MTAEHQVSVLNVDAKGNYWRETLPTKDALLKLLRFLRKNPQAVCTIELHLPEGFWDDPVPECESFKETGTTVSALSSAEAPQPGFRETAAAA